MVVRTSKGSAQRRRARAAPAAAAAAAPAASERSDRTCLSEEHDNGSALHTPHAHTKADDGAIHKYDQFNIPC